MIMKKLFASGSITALMTIPLMLFTSGRAAILSPNRSSIALKLVSAISACRSITSAFTPNTISVIDEETPRTIPSKVIIAPTVSPIAPIDNTVRVDRCHKLCTAIPPMGNLRIFFPVLPPSYLNASTGSSFAARQAG